MFEEIPLKAFEFVCQIYARRPMLIWITRLRKKTFFYSFLTLRVIEATMRCQALFLFVFFLHRYEQRGPRAQADMSNETPQRAAVCLSQASSYKLMLNIFKGNRHKITKRFALVQLKTNLVPLSQTDLKV